jgi:cytochrome c
MSSSKKIWDNPKRKHIIEQWEDDTDIPDGDVNKGQRLFKDMCQGCHSMEGNKWLGPNLKDVYNRKMVAGKWNYTGQASNLKGAYWTKKRLNDFLKDPERIIPDTAMVFDGVKDAYDRACIIEYLHYLKVSSAK